MNKKIQLIIYGIFLSCNLQFAVAKDNFSLIKETKIYGSYNENRNHSAGLLGLEFTLNKKPISSINNLSLAYSLDYVSAETKQIIRKGYSDSTEWFAAGPKLTYTFDNGIYIGGGVGAAYMTNKRFGSHRTGKNWQFSPNYSIGYNINSNLFIEYKYMHFSNARTAMPNPGWDFHFIGAGYRF